MILSVGITYIHLGHLVFVINTKMDHYPI